MKLGLQILGAVIALFLLYLAISALLGYLIGAVVIGVFAVCIGAVLKMVLFGNREKTGPDLSNVHRAEKDAEKMLRQMERKAKTDQPNR